MPDQLSHDLFLEFIKTQKSGEMLFCYDRNLEFTKAVINAFFCRGTEGLEIVNYYSDFPTPKVAKIIRLIRGKISIEGFSIT